MHGLGRCQELHAGRDLLVRVVHGVGLARPHASGSAGATMVLLLAGAAGFLALARGACQAIGAKQRLLDLVLRLLVDLADLEWCQDTGAAARKESARVRCGGGCGGCGLGARRRSACGRRRSSGGLLLALDRRLDGSAAAAASANSVGLALARLPRLLGRRWRHRSSGRESERERGESCARGESKKAPPPRRRLRPSSETQPPQPTALSLIPSLSSSSLPHRSRSLDHSRSRSRVCVRSRDLAILAGGSSVVVAVVAVALGFQQ